MESEAPTVATNRTWLQAFLLGCFLTLFTAGCPEHQEPPTDPPEDRWSHHAPSDFLEVGSHLRAGRLTEARHQLEAVLNLSSGQEGTSSSVLGLAAFEKKRYRQAIRSLRLEPENSFPLRDWRWLALAESAILSNNTPLAKDFLKSLEENPQSPLRPLALKLRLLLPFKEQNLSDFRTALDELRRLPLPRELTLAVEKRALQAAEYYSDTELQREALRRLVVDLVADQEVELTSSLPDFLQSLSESERIIRSEQLLSKRRYRDAVETLELTPESDRGEAWIELSARIALKRQTWGDLLTLLPLLPPAEDAEGNLLRGRLYLGASRARRSMGALTSKELHQLGIEALSKVIPSDRTDLAEEALVDIFRAQNRKKNYPEAIAAFHRLHNLNLANSRLAGDLWSLAWSSWRRGATEEALDRFEEILHLEGATNYRRAAAYWRARCIDKLGSPQRAQELFRKVAGEPISDFYRRQALERIDEPEPLGLLPTELEQWPKDPRLDRVELLLALGLDTLAARELALLEPLSDPRASAAMRSRILAAEGRRRQVIGPLKRAFPKLGTTDEVDLAEEILQHYYPLEYADEIRHWAKRRSLPTPLVFALIRQESAFDRRATSRVNARGLMQLMPATARELAGKEKLSIQPQDLWKPEVSVRLGTRYLRQVIDLFDGDLELALAGYNGGPYRIRRWWKQSRDPKDEFIENLRLSESRTYVKRVLLLSGSYARLYPEDLAPVAAPPDGESRAETR